MIKIKTQKKSPFEIVKRKTKHNEVDTFLYLESHVAEKYNENMDIDKFFYIKLLSTDKNYNANINSEKLLSIKINNNNKSIAEKYIEKLKTILNQQENLNDILKAVKTINEEDFVEIDVTNRYFENKNAKTFNFNATNVSTNDYDRIPIFMLIRTLANLNYIEILENPSPNGREEFYKFLPVNTDGAININPKVSVLSERSFSSYQEDFMKERENRKNKALLYSDVKSVLYQNGGNGSSGSLNFMKDLERIGVFGKPLNQPNYSNKDEVTKYNKAQFAKIMKVLKNEIVPEIGGLNNFKVSNKKLLDVSTSNTRYPVRLPTKDKKFNEKYYNYLLNERQLNKDILDREISNQRIYTGIDFTYNSYNQSMFFSMYDSKFGKFPQSVENTSIGEVNRKEKLIKRHAKDRNRKKLLYGTVKKSPKATIFSEAVIDSIALESLFKYSNKNIDDYNFISSQGAGNINTWLENVIGIGFSNTKSDKEEFGDAYKIKTTEKKEPITEKNLYALKQALSKKRLHYVNDGKTVTEKKLFKLRKFLEKVDQTKKVEEIKLNNRNGYINLKEYNKEDYILDNTNLEAFFEENNLHLEYNKDNKDYDIFIKYSIQNKEKIDENDNKFKESVKKKLKEIFNTDHLILAYDNDVGGLKYYEPFYNMCKSLDIPVSLLVPPDVNDNNDLLKKYNKMKKDNGTEVANNYLEKEYFYSLSEDIVLNNKFDEIFKLAQEEDMKEKKNSSYKKKTNSLRP
tara:strand:- start:12798 stop:15020 length:2223 start_codon:yes stop_codon:yes gene_type:complete